MAMKVRLNTVKEKPKVASPPKKDYGEVDSKLLITELEAYEALTKEKNELEEFRSNLVNFEEVLF